jgi:hypothetical protein
MKRFRDNVRLGICFRQQPVGVCQAGVCIMLGGFAEYLFHLSGVFQGAEHRFGG